MKKLFSSMSKLQIHYHFKQNFQNVDKDERGNWLNHGTKNHKDNQLRSL